MDTRCGIKLQAMPVPYSQFSAVLGLPPTQSSKNIDVLFYPRNQSEADWCAEVVANLDAISE